jgi:hypothetical protein
VPFLLANVAPYFVALDILYRDVDDQAAHQLLAAFAGQDEHFHNRVPVNSGDSHRASDGIPFDEELQREHGLFLGQVHFVERQPVRFGEGASALSAPETAKAVPVAAETLALSFAIGAGHFDLRFCCALHALIILRALVVCKRKITVNVKFLRCVFNGFLGIIRSRQGNVAKAQGTAK